MAVSIVHGSFSGVLGLIEGSFRADPHGNHIAHTYDCFYKLRVRFCG